jgi:hypothetical protein
MGRKYGRTIVSVKFVSTIFRSCIEGRKGTINELHSFEQYRTVHNPHLFASLTLTVTVFKLYRMIARNVGDYNIVSLRTQRGTGMKTERAVRYFCEQVYEAYTL